MKRQSLARVVVVLACLAAATCGGPSPPSTPTTVATTPNQPTTSAPVIILIAGVGCSNQNGCFTADFVVGAAAQFTATAEFPGGIRKDITSEAQWESTDTTIATVTRSGQVTGVGAGYVQVRAAYNGVTGSMYVQVAARSPGAAACGFDGATGPQSTDWQAKTSGVLIVLTAAGCSWTATTDASWITLTGPVSGAGTIGSTASAQVSYSVAEYQYSTAAPRVGHITVRSASGVLRTSDITQWANCSGPPKEQAVSFGGNGGQSARFDVLLGYPAVCKWRIISDADWITISGASTTVLQIGDGDFHINANPNPGSSPRSAKVYADGTVYVVTQAGRQQKPYDLGCADYNGEFTLADPRQYCYSLTTTDFATRYLSRPESESEPGVCRSRVGVRQVGERIWLVTFMHYGLGYFDDETCWLEPIENPFGPKLLPMSPE